MRLTLYTKKALWKAFQEYGERLIFDGDCYIDDKLISISFIVSSEKTVEVNKK